MDWLVAILWICIVCMLYAMGGYFLRQARQFESGTTGRHMKLSISLLFIIVGSIKLFDILFVNLGAAPEPIPFISGGIDSANLLYFGLLVMTFYLIGFSFLLFALEKHMLHTKYILTSIPLLTIILSWILTLAGANVDVFLDAYYTNPDNWILIFFYLSRAFIPFSYFYLTIKTSGNYRKSAFTLFLGYAILVTFFIRQPLFEFLAPYLIFTGLFLILFGHHMKTED